MPSGISTTSRAGETFGDKKYHSQGSAFAIGPKTFVTAFHVIVDLHKTTGSLAAATLEREGGSARLKVKRVVAVHVAHDLAVFEIDQRAALTSISSPVTARLWASRFSSRVIWTASSATRPPTSLSTGKPSPS